jgi:hypothetical protein
MLTSDFSLALHKLLPGYYVHREPFTHTSFNLVEINAALELYGLPAAAPLAEYFFVEDSTDNNAKGILLRKEDGTKYHLGADVEIIVIHTPPQEDTILRISKVEFCKVSEFMEAWNNLQKRGHTFGGLIFRTDQDVLVKE